MTQRQGEQEPCSGIALLYHSPWDFETDVIVAFNVTRLERSEDTVTTAYCSSQR